MAEILLKKKICIIQNQAVHQTNKYITSQDIQKLSNSFYKKK